MSVNKCRYKIYLQREWSFKILLRYILSSRVNVTHHVHTQSPVSTSMTPNSSVGSPSSSSAQSGMRHVRCGDGGKSESTSPPGWGAWDASGSTPLPLASGTERCTGADMFGMATSTHTASVAASFSVWVPTLGSGGGDRAPKGVELPIGAWSGLGEEGQEVREKGLGRRS